MKFLALYYLVSFDTVLTGPGGRGNFFESTWQAALSDPNAKDSYDTRHIVLGRLRLPDAPKYEEAREGQGYPYFMPWLSGDNGEVHILGCNSLDR